MPIKLRIFIANTLAGALDLCMGVFFTTGILAAFGLKPALWQLAVGATLAILPDFDIVPTVLRGREATGNHRVSLMHRPLLILPLATLIAYAIGGTVWLCIALVCVTWHYLHDTPPLSQGGIAWAWPFDTRYWSWFGPKPPLDDTGLTHHEWLKRYWMRPSRLSVTEIGTGLLALLAALAIALR